MCGPATTRTSTGPTPGTKPQLGKLVKAAHKGQWLADDLAWSTDVDPVSTEVDLVLDEATPLYELPAYHRMSSREQAHQRSQLMAWMLSQFLHGEQGALFALVPGDRGRQLVRGQAVRGDPGDGRGPARRGLPAVPR